MTAIKLNIHRAVHLKHYSTISIHINIQINILTKRIRVFARRMF